MSERSLSEQILSEENERLTQEIDRLTGLLDRPVYVTVTTPPPPVSVNNPMERLITAVQSINNTLWNVQAEVLKMNARLDSQ